MCDNCVEFDDEDMKWVGVSCTCACAEGSLNPSSDGSSICTECNHRVRG